MNAAATLPTGRSVRWRALGLGAAVLVSVLGSFAFAEWRGWPWLAAPLEQSLSQRLGRPLRLHALPDFALPLPASATAATAASAAIGAPTEADFSLRLWGGLRLRATRLELAAPAWSDAPYTLRAQGLALELRYADLWRAWRGQALRLHSLQADRVDGHVERLADGRASWQIGASQAVDAPATPWPYAHTLQLRDGRLRVKDAVLGVDAQAVWTLANTATGASPQTPRTQLKLQTSGRYQKSPLKLELLAQGDLAVAADASGKRASTLRLHAVVGRARLDFDGVLKDTAGADDLQGHFKLSGPSLAAVGDPVGVTLPTTAAFQSQGDLRKTGSTWHVVVDTARIGGSQLQGAFVYDQSRSVPLLAGRLSGPRLLLKDLGPAVGVAPTVVSSSAAAPAASPRAQSGPDEAAPPRPGKVLPDRPFDLAALRVMDANVLIDITEVDLNTRYLEPLRPLKAHLLLAGGVLNIGALDAQLGAGRLRGNLQLDGRSNVAAVRTDLRWDGLRLERWINQPRAAADAPPFVSGALQGWARLQGQGQSTAQVLARLSGRLRTELRDGRVSHLAIEAAGLDIAQALGVLIKGDDALPVLCAVADLNAQNGVFVPRVMVLDSTDSTLWVDGSVSLASEALDLRVVVSPKDFSPLALRTPLRLRGTLDQPKVSIEGGRLAGRVGLAFLLALANPLAALVPLLDPGDKATAADNAAGCRDLVQRGANRPAGRTAPTPPNSSVR